MLVLPQIYYIIVAELELMVAFLIYHKFTDEKAKIFGRIRTFGRKL